MKRALVIIAGMGLLASQARADVDNFGLGNGLTPAPTMGLNTVVNSYASVTQVNAASVQVPTAGDAAPFDPANNGGRNVLAMVWVSKRLAAAPDVGTPFNLDPTITGAWELARVDSISTTPNVTINFVNPLIGSYPAGSVPAGDIQVVLVPEFASLTVGVGQSIVPKAWDGSSGGIIAMLVQGALTVDGTIDASGRGFNGGAHAGAFFNANPSPACTSTSEGLTDGSAGTRGENHSSSQGTGRKYLANGGGGGLCLDNGGGGGGNGGRGGDGDSSNVGTGTPLPGHGGGQINFTPLTHFAFGGGGGAGQLTYLTLDPTQADGANGGGAIFIRTGTLAGITGAIHADGLDANGGVLDDVGHGGGGGGGSIIVRVAGSTTICANITAAGGVGGTGTTNSGRGGGGGGGHIYVQASPACTTEDVSPGAHGGGGAGPGIVGQIDTVPLGPYCTNDGQCAGATGRHVCHPSDNSCVECSSSERAACDHNNPVCPTTTCVPGCATNGDCSLFNTFPICNTASNTPNPGGAGTCQRCGNSGQCPVSNPVCDTANDTLKGACVQCNDDGDCLNDSFPICDTGTHTCQPCTGSGDNASCAANHSGKTVCNPVSGACVQCIDNSTCGPAAPTCNTVNSTCAGCDIATGDTGCGSGHCHRTGDVGTSAVGTCVECTGTSAANANAECTTSTTPGCGTNNTCQSCNNFAANNACAGHTGLPFCLSGTGACVQCLGSGDCTNPKPICSGNSCSSCGSNAQCEGKSATTPVCSGGSCGPCGGDTDCTVSGLRPACQGDGSCKQCSATNLSLCDTSQPVCSAGGSCGLCTAEAQCSRFPSTPNCETAATGSHGHCVECRSDTPIASSDCTTNAKPMCTGNVCGACSGGAGETACQANHGGAHCEQSSSPPGLNGQCVQCRSELTFANTDCTSATPLCGANDTCGACDTAGSTECVKFGATFVCDDPATGGNGACVGCVTDNDCQSPTNPHCVSKQCVNCDSTTVTHGDESCTHFNPDAGVPACQPADGIAASAGQCKQCSFFNRDACTGSTPACNFVTGGCQLCTVENGDMGDQSTGCATNNNGHRCEGSGTSVFCGCTTDADCGSATSGRICDTISHLCQDGCSRAAGHNNCPSGQFCSSDDTTGAVTGVCTMTCQFDQDCASMTTMPFCINVQHSDAGVDAGTMGRCAGCRTDADCGGQTPVCEPTTKVCVQCTDTRLDVCSAGNTGAICLPDETCGCAADSDCGAADSGRICDLMTTHKCVTGCRVVGGNGCPSGLICDGAGLVPGKCVAFVDMAMNIPDASEQDLSVPIDMAQNTSFRLQGGGIGCSVGGPTDVSFGAFVLLALAALGLRRRRRQ